MVPLGEKKKMKSSFSPSWKWEETSQGERALTQLLFLVHEMERKCREPGNLPGMRRQNLCIPESMSNPLWFRRSYLEGQQIWTFLIWRLVHCVPQREGGPCFHQAQSIRPPCPLLTSPKGLHTLLRNGSLPTKSMFPMEGQNYFLKIHI